MQYVIKVLEIITISEVIYMREENKGKQSFIVEARREQIIGAAIKTLDEIGYVSASLSQKLLNKGESYEGFRASI